MAETAIAKFTYPTDDDPPDGPAQISQLAQEIEATNIVKFPDAATRDAVLGRVVPDGRMAYLTGPDLFVVYDATLVRWVEFSFTQPTPVVWKPLTLNAKWTAPGGGWDLPQYCQDAIGQVHMRGLVRNTGGTTLGGGAAITSVALPAGLRPPAQQGWSTWRKRGAPSTTVTTLGRIDVTAAGLVVLGSSFENGSYALLNEIHYFPA